MIRTIAEEGRTVLFSSHLLDEVERVSDRLAMIVDGRLIFSGQLEEVKEGHEWVTLLFDEPRSEPPRHKKAFGWEGGDREWTALWSRGDLRGLGDAPRVSIDRGILTTDSMDRPLEPLRVGGTGTERGIGMGLSVSSVLSVVEKGFETVEQAAAAWGARIGERRPATLEEIFVARASSSGDPG